METIEFPEDRPTVPASWESRCTICDEKIFEGDPITLVDGEWVHAECAKDYDESS